MSFSAIRWALAQDSLDDPREVLLLVVLADYYNDKTCQCNPSRDTLKKRARIGNNNTLTAKLSTLQKKGLITVYSQNGKSNCYRLKLESTLETEPPPSSELNHLPSSAVNHEPINEPIKEPINNSKERAPDFSLTAPEKTTISKKETVAKKERKPRSPYPFSENDPIPEEFLKIAQSYNIQDPQKLFKNMILWCKANDKPYKNWKAGYTRWCIKEVEFKKAKEQKTTSKPFAYEPSGGFTDEFYMKGCKFDKNGNLIL